MRRLGWLVFFLLSQAALSREVQIAQKTYVPVFKDPGETDTVIGPIYFDQTPVTNRQYLKFVTKYPEFSKSRIPALFADKNYLSQWQNDFIFVKSEGDFPVTHVTWFSARKYCEALGKRLPTIAEWEVASDAQNPKLEKAILQWYSSPESKLRVVGTRPANKFGLKDMHGLIWEWVDNFSEIIMSGDSRGGSSTAALFCGGAALRAKDPRLYAAFMRFAFRSSLTAKYESGNLGFRCVKDL